MELQLPGSFAASSSQVLAFTEVSPVQNAIPARLQPFLDSQPSGWGNKYTAVAKAVSVCRELQVENTEAQEGLQAEPALTDTMVYPGLHCRLPRPAVVPC